MTIKKVLKAQTFKRNIKQTSVMIGLAPNELLMMQKSIAKKDRILCMYI